MCDWGGVQNMHLDKTPQGLPQLPDLLLCQEAQAKLKSPLVLTAYVCGMNNLTVSTHAQIQHHTVAHHLRAKKSVCVAELLNLILNTWRMNLSPEGLPVGLWTYCLFHYPLPPHPTKPPTIPSPRHGCSGCLPLATLVPIISQILKRVCGKKSGTAHLLSPTELLCHLCVCNVKRWIRQQGSVDNGEWRQSRAEQSPLDDVFSKMWVTVCAMRLPACVLEDHGTSVYTHTEHHDRQLVTVEPYYTSNAHIDMSNTEKWNTQTKTCLLFWW